MAYMTFVPFTSSTPAPDISTPSYTLKSPGSSPSDMNCTLVYTVGTDTHSCVALLHCLSTCFSCEVSIHSAAFSGSSGAAAETVGFAYSVPSARHIVYFTVPVEV